MSKSKLIFGSPVPVSLYFAGRWTQSSPAAGQHCSCWLSFGAHRPEELVELQDEPSTADQLTVPLMNCGLMLSAEMKTL